MRYFFDVRDNNELFVDEEGVELPTLAAVQQEVVLSLAGMARDAAQKMFNDAAHEMAIEARDESGPVCLAKFTIDLSWKIN